MLKKLIKIIVGSTIFLFLVLSAEDFVTHSAIKSKRLKKLKLATSINLMKIKRLKLAARIRKYQQQQIEDAKK
jgi:hypothetical protein